MKSIIFHPEAEVEFELAIARYESQRQGIGVDFREEVEAAIHSIQQNPKLRSKYKKTNFRKCVLKRFPFNIFYLEREADIWIAAVAHQKRRPDYWKDRVTE